MNNPRTLQAKIVLLGDAGVGKSSIIQRFISGSFTEYGAPTVGASFLSKLIEFDQRTIKLNIWDTAGQEKFNSLSISYCRACNACIFVYDITKRRTFEGMKKWYNNVQQLLEADTILIVVGNKEDVIDEEEVSLNESRCYSESIQANFYKVSAKQGIGISKMFTEIGEKLLGLDSINFGGGVKSSIALSAGTAPVKKQNCC